MDNAQKSRRLKPSSPDYDMWTCNRLFQNTTKDISTGCILWSGPVNKLGGYGRIGYRGKVWRAHRLSYTLLVSDIPNGLEMLHSCDNPRCINPSHLRPGTHAENISEAYDKGRKTVQQGTSHPRFKFTSEQVKEVLTSQESVKLLAERIGVSPSAIFRLRNGTTWKSLERTQQ